VPDAVVVPAAAQLARAGAALVGDAPERAVVLLSLALRADRAAAEAVLVALDAAEPEPAHAAAFAFVRGEALRAAGRHEESRIAYASAESLAREPADTGAPRSSQ
jgi:predicted negative regulator of RcsB-dependent stress response